MVFCAVPCDYTNPVKPFGKRHIPASPPHTTYAVRRPDRKCVRMFAAWNRQSVDPVSLDQAEQDRALQTLISAAQRHLHRHAPADHLALYYQSSKSLRRATNVRQPAGQGASRDCGAVAQKRIQRRCRKAMDAEHADGSVRLQDRRLRIASIESQAEPRPSLIRVFCVDRLTASALRFLLRGAAGRCWRTHCQARGGAHASGTTPGHSGVYGAAFWVAANGCAVCFGTACGGTHTALATCCVQIAHRTQPLRCHGLRHAFASRFSRVADDIPILRANTGHTYLR